MQCILLLVLLPQSSDVYKAVGSFNKYCIESFIIHDSLSTIELPPPNIQELKYVMRRSAWRACFTLIYTRVDKESGFHVTFEFGRFFYAIYLDITASRYQSRNRWLGFFSQTYCFFPSSQKGYCQSIISEFLSQFFCSS